MGEFQTITDDYIEVVRKIFVVMNIYTFGYILLQLNHRMTANFFVYYNMNKRRI